MKKRLLFTIIALIGIFTLIPASFAMAQTWAPNTTPTGQTPLVASTIPQFVTPLPILDSTGAPNGTIKTILAGNTQIDINMEEFRANMLPSTFVPETGTYDGTWVWGYVAAGTDTTLTRDTYTGPVVVATRGIPSTFKFTNNLGTTATTHALAYTSAIDQSLHWANPNNVDKYVSNPFTPADPPWLGNPDHYSGPIPAAVHLHGAEDPAAVDGGPESWFTSTGQVGKAFYSEGWDGVTPQNYAIYTYPNVQEASPIWFHDHTLGATRLNVYMGLAGGYMIVDPALALPAGLNATGLRDGALGPNPIDDTVIPLVIQDRMFDTNGQLYFPAGAADPVNPSLNPEHPYWAPEFLGESPNIHDTICVNGKTWPYLEVKDQRYSFLTIDGSNARSYLLSFDDTAANVNAYHPTIWQIGTDQGYLDTPVAVNPLRIMPGERAQFIIDFSGIPAGTNLVLNNFGPDTPLSMLPVPLADMNDPATTGTVMQFRVVGGAAVPDTSFDPSSGADIRTGSDAIVRLVDPSAGTLAAGVVPALTRQLTLNEIARDLPTVVDGIVFSGGPLEILVNNTKWMGMRNNDMDPNMMGDMIPGFVADGLGNFLSEMPVEGTTEVWEIVNMSMDSHPIHTHLAQFQLMNREAFVGDPSLMVGGYYDAYPAAFPGGMFIPGYGPPQNYDPALNPLSGGKYGGNPDVTPYLSGVVMPPDANEAGWKDTVMAPPGMVTRFVIRWGPTDAAVGTPDLKYSFVPNGPTQGVAGGMYDYVWHCHIVDHEDNEMMRPDVVYAPPVVNAGSDAAIAEDSAFNSAGSFRASGAAPWTATVDYGDGSGVQPLALSGMQFSLNHVYDEDGEYTVTVTVSDVLGASVSDTALVTVEGMDGARVWQLDSEIFGAPTDASDIVPMVQSSAVPIYEMEKSKGPGDDGQTGSVEVPSGESRTWVSDLAALADVTYAADGAWKVEIATDSEWIDADASGCTVLIGQWDGSTFIPFSSVFNMFSVTWDTEAGKYIFELQGQSNDETVDKGNYLAMQIMNTDEEDHIVYTGKGNEASCLTSPENDPGYPLPEMATGLLMALGLAGLAGFVVIRRRKSGTAS
jgi:spore coat protein A, manganese oxidase